MSRPLSVLGIAGSLRSGSLNRALLRAAAEVAPQGLSIAPWPLDEIPLYNGDVEAAGAPEPVARFKAAIRAADALLFVTPEYNHGVPGVMKNMIDWCSRPPRRAVLERKPVAVIGASPGMTGSARGQSQLRQAFEFTNSYCMPQPEFLLARADMKFDAQGRLADTDSSAFLQRFLEAFADWTRVFVPTRQDP